MSDFLKQQSPSNENWLDNLDKIQDGARRNYFSALPEEEQFQKYFSEAFIINKPKGKIGRDGYWLHTSGRDLYFALFTFVEEGHLTSMMIRIYINALRKMVEEYLINFPGSILQFLHREVTARFRNKNNILLNTNANVSIVKINPEAGQMEFAGANMDLIQIDIDSKISIIEGEKRQIGEAADQIKSYPSNSIENMKNSSFYLCGTGVFNLIGGSDFKKLMLRDLTSFLRMNRKLTLNEQKIEINRFFNEWTGSRGQNDNIMVIGLRP
ncbi:MAG: hypothetical protein GDA51_00065 [Ekhidna sp.]|nr:hypothetical protein [Ekhidna sp.]